MDTKVSNINNNDNDDSDDNNNNTPKGNTPIAIEKGHLA